MRFRFLATLLLVLLAFVSLPCGAHEQEQYIDAHYHIRFQENPQVLAVTAVFSNLRTEKIYMGFSNSFSVARRDNLTERVQHAAIQPDTTTLTKHNIDENLLVYEVNTGNEKEITLAYLFDSSKIEFEHHMTTVTKSYIHIPGADFFLRLFENQRDPENFGYYGGQNLVKQLSVTFENLPEDWEILSTYNHIDENTVRIDDVKGSDVLLSAGKYKVIEISSGEARIQVGLDKGLKLDVSKYSNDIEAIFQHYFQLYGHIPESEILMVVHHNPLPMSPLSYSMGGQVRTRNIMNCIGWGSAITDVKARILGLLAHEAHHIWVSHGFNVKDDWSWFWEGFTEYMSNKSLLTLGLAKQSYFDSELGRRFINYHRNPQKDSTSLVEASLKNKRNRRESALLYDKGTLTAYLLDKKLQQKGKNLETFLKDFYKQQAIPKKPVTNPVIIAAIDDVLGGPDFTKNYVTGTAEIGVKEFDFGWKYYYWAIKRYLPPLPFPFNIVVPLVLLPFVVFLPVWIVRRLARFFAGK